MPKILIVYYSRSGNTKKMAELIAEGARKSGKSDIVLKSVEEISIDELLQYDGIIAGSPVYYGTMAAELKMLFDKSIKIHGKLDNKIGGAFASSANVGGGNETTVLDILKAMLIHGMIIKGDAKGDHYGPVSIGKPDERASKECLRYGENIARLAAEKPD